MQLHTIDPVYDGHSRVLILGSFPSVKSREAGFFYGHPRNRFWPVLAALLGEPVPAAEDLAAKQALLSSLRATHDSTVAHRAVGRDRCLRDQRQRRQYHTGRTSC